MFVEGLPAGTCYAWRMDGPQDTEQTGRRFNPRKDLLDPWARGVSDAAWDRRRAADPAEAGHASLRALVTDVPPRLPRVEPRGLDGAVIYELHVGGFTRHPSSGVEHPGTFAGLIEKIPYLRELGVTHVELMPVMAFDAQDVPPAAAARGLRNYWGYSTHSFWSPHPRYCREPARAAHEFRALTDALHAAGIGVLLDVVFNHTAEAGASGPVINFKGLANDVVYMLDPADRRRYRDFTGCGNTVSCNHPLVTTFIVRCLEYWVERLGVDGFRFDLASVFARDARGDVIADPPLPWALESSPILARAPMIAEAWDAAGLYQVGGFPGMAWAEWNGRYRDAVRRFVRGDPWTAGEVATRIAGSADLYGDGRLPGNSINYVTCHDGFTLHDLVSYDRKHNEANGEDNRDGSDDNISWNCGVEGETSDPAVLGAAAAAGPQPPRDPDALARGPDDPRGRRGAAQPRRQQQRLLPGQRALVVRLGADRGQPRHAALRARADRPSPPPSVPDGQPLLHRRRRSRAASCPTSPGTARASRSSRGTRRPAGFCASLWPGSSPAKRTCTRS